MKSRRTPPLNSHAAPRGRRVLINTGALAGSSLWRIGISFILQVLIARALGIEAIGQYVTVMAFMNVSQVIGELGLPGLLIRDLARRPEQSRLYFSAALRLQIPAALVLWLALIALGRLLPFSAEIAASLWIVGASLPLYALTSASRTLFQAAERMEYVLSVEVFTNTLILLLSVLALYFGGGVVQLIALILITQAVSVVLSLFLVTRQRLLARSPPTARVNLPALLRRARPFYLLALADVFLNRIDVLLLNIVAGDFVVGIYSLAYNVVRVALRLIQSYWQALYPTLSRLLPGDVDRYHRLSSLSLRFGMIIVLPGSAIVFGVAGDLLWALYASSSEAAVFVLRLLVLTAPAFALEMYAIVQLMVHGRPHASLNAVAVHILAVVLALPALATYFGAPGAALAILIAACLGTGAGLYLLKTMAIDFQIPRFGLMLAGSVLAGFVATLAPTGWALRMCAGMVVCGLVFWWGGVITVKDARRLRAALGGG